MDRFRQSTFVAMATEPTENMLMSPDHVELLLPLHVTELRF